MLDCRFHYAVMVTEERVRNVLRDRSLQTQLVRIRPSPVPRPEGRRSWSIADFEGVIVPNRGAR